MFGAGGVAISLLSTLRSTDTSGALYVSSACCDHHIACGETPVFSTFFIKFCGVEPLLLTSITTPKF